jgi:hypothetical protein
MILKVGPYTLIQRIETAEGFVSHIILINNYF